MKIKLWREDRRMRPGVDLHAGCSAMRSTHHGPLLTLALTRRADCPTSSERRLPSVILFIVTIDSFTQNSYGVQVLPSARHSTSNACSWRALFLSLGICDRTRFVWGSQSVAQCDPSPCWNARSPWQRLAPI